MGNSTCLVIRYVQIANPVFYHLYPSGCQKLKSQYLEGKDIEQICG